MKKQNSRERSSPVDDSLALATAPAPAKHLGRKRKTIKGALAALAVLLVILLIIWIPVRASAMNWGATEAEVQAPLPGDEAMTHPISVSTRAVTINAPAAVVWPWIVQMGYQRAGWYSYDWIEWLLGADVYVDGHSATRIHPELQHLKLGDMVYTASGAGARVIHLQPNRYLVVGASWAFVLRPIDTGHTRFIVRTRHGGFLKHSAPILGGAFYAFDSILALPFYEPGLHFFMERKMMLGIKERAERTWRNRAAVTANAGTSEGARV